MYLIRDVHWWGCFILLHRCVGSQHINAGVVRVWFIYISHPCPGGFSDNFFPREHCQNTLIHINSEKRPRGKKDKETKLGSNEAHMTINIHHHHEYSNS